jgi:predicted Fe-S protein YdhL (DUF1289 family)
MKTDYIFLMSAISSPCINICTLDAVGGACLGCGRSVDEITRWSTMPDAERTLVIAALAGWRAATLPARSEGTNEA